jgi:succinate dehydrogenase/fumarate reductase flavoprotein subunit
LGATGTPETVGADVLVIGGGGVGLRAAIEARAQGADVLLVSQSRVGHGSNTAIAGGAFAAVGDAPAEGDSWERHLEDTIAAGGLINDRRLVTAVVRGAAQQITDLRRFGVEYADPESSPWIGLSVDPGHSRSRMVYTATPLGTDFTFPMRRHALSQGVRFMESVLVTCLLQNGGRVVGATGVDDQGQPVVFQSRSVILATGGLGQVYARTDNTAGSTGDGYVLAHGAGAILKDMEFVQFYPTCLGMGSPAVFHESLLFGAGGRLLNRLGEDIVAKHGLADPMLMTRDRLSLAISREIAAGLGIDDVVVLDSAGIAPETLQTVMPVLPKAARRGERRFSVAPATHFMMGGVAIDETAATGVPGLFAAGEVCAGVQGASRLSGNALTEVWVFGTIAGREAAKSAAGAVSQAPDRGQIGDEIDRLGRLSGTAGGESLNALRHELRETMWRHAGVIRNAAGLEKALGVIAGLRERCARASTGGPRELQRLIKLGNMLAVAEMVCRSALHRTESRGAHHRADHPRRDDANWLSNTVLRMEDGAFAPYSEPVVGQTSVRPERTER